MDNRKYNELDIAKGIAIIAVVLGHAFPDADTGISSLTANVIHEFVYGFHMPVFFFIAGLLSAKHVADARLPYLKKRTAKLLIPYFGLSIVGLVLKQIFASEANNAFSLSNAIFIPFGKSPMGGMWYLWTLFVLSAIFILLIRYVKEDWMIVLVGVAFHYLYFFKSFSYIHNVLNFGIYFMLGVACKNMYPKLRELDHKVIACATIPTYYIAIKIICPDIVLGMIGIVMVLSVSNIINSKLLADMGRKSYAIYLMSYFIAIPIRVLLYQRLAINYWVVVALMFVLGLFIPYGIAKLVELKSDKSKMELF